jgi:phosphoesterase RecJ-like protein
MQHLEVLKELLGSPKKIVITTHHKPDADALGSSLALLRYLEKKGHQTNVITPSDYPDFLYWMSGNEKVIIYNQENEKRIEELTMQADLIFCLDFSAIQRINDYGPIVSKAPAKKVLIDHHLEPESFADIVIWDTNAAATAVLIYELIISLGDKTLIDTCIGECIYAGIMTDTGSFRHPSTNRQVHLIIAELMLFSVDTSRIHRLIYDNNSEVRLRFLGFALLKKLVVLHDMGVAYITVSEEELLEFQSQTGDTEGLVNYALSMKNVIMAAVIIERPDAVKLSFRSKGEFSVNKFARTHFEGGGHKNASGGRSALSLEATVDKFISILPQYKNELLENIKTEKSIC